MRLYISRRGKILNRPVSEQILNYVLVEVENLPAQAVFEAGGRECINLDLLDDPTVERIMELVQAYEDSLRDAA